MVALRVLHDVSNVFKVGESAFFLLLFKSIDRKLELDIKYKGFDVKSIKNISHAFFSDLTSNPLYLTSNRNFLGRKHAESSQLRATKRDEER